MQIEPHRAPQRKKPAYLEIVRGAIRDKLQVALPPLILIALLAGCTRSDLEKTATEVQWCGTFKEHSERLPPIIRGISSQKPLYDFAYFNGPRDQAVYNKAFQARVTHSYPVGSLEKLLITELAKQGFRRDEESGSIDYQNKRWTMYKYVDAANASVGTWLIAWLSNSKGQIIEIHCETITGTK